MKELESTDAQITAGRFINSTNANIFLTGKAGTGKTTFLKNLANITHKTFIVVAPTGIAALNAGGTTIHSQFLLPFGMFMPGNNVHPSSGTYTGYMLTKQHPLNSQRKQVLRSIDLLVIDEVSMLRADLLDAIDHRLKAARGNFRQPFGGVQLLLIGDLYQLPPVVKREEESLLKQYYDSAWFYESHALKQSGFAYIELDKIFRQSDRAFIDLLNNLRNNCVTHDDIDELNQHYKDAEYISNLREVITLTTHNYKADNLNQRALAELETPSHFFKAFIEGDFPESMYPVLPKLELKEGAQIMFVKNDTEIEKAYFNGKLATVKSIKGDTIIVEMAESGIPYTLKKEVWENKRYTLKQDEQLLHEDVIGSFEQYPVKLAWAITVHKSQGLTFDKAIIDVGQAFADGQVYVALSRLRSLDGLILRTRINTNVISTDNEIVNFTTTNHRPDELHTTIKDRQQEYIVERMHRAFDFEDIVKEIANTLHNREEDADSIIDESMQPILQQISAALIQENNNTLNFRKQLQTLAETDDITKLLERLQKGNEYYHTLLWEQLRLLLQHREEMEHRKRMKTYLSRLAEIDQLLFKKIIDADKVIRITEAIVRGTYNFDFTTLLFQRNADRATLLNSIREKTLPTKKKKGKKNKDERSTYDITLELFKSGMSIDAIAQQRELSVGTIESHVVKLIENNRIDIHQFVTVEDTKAIIELLVSTPDVPLSQLFNKAEGKFSYAQLRAVIAYKARQEGAN